MILTDIARIPAVSEVTQTTTTTEQPSAFPKTDSQPTVLIVSTALVILGIALIAFDFKRKKRSSHTLQS